MKLIQENLNEDRPQKFIERHLKKSLCINHDYSTTRIKHDPENVIMWLIIQSNANGTPYFENVVRKYMNNLYSAPMTLSSLTFKNMDVFTYHTVDELNSLGVSFKTASNYNQVNDSKYGG